MFRDQYFTILPTTYMYMHTHTHTHTFWLIRISGIPWIMLTLAATGWESTPHVLGCLGEEDTSDLYVHKMVH